MPDGVGVAVRVVVAEGLGLGVWGDPVPVRVAADGGDGVAVRNATGGVVVAVPCGVSLGTVPVAVAKKIGDVPVTLGVGVTDSIPGGSVGVLTSKPGGVPVAVARGRVGDAGIVGTGVGELTDGIGVWTLSEGQMMSPSKSTQRC